MDDFRIKQIDSMTFVGVIIVLTPTELKKLECKDFEKSIDNIVKELNIDWAVETDGQHPIVVVSRMYGSEVTVDSAELHDLTIAGTNFLCAIDKLELQKSPATRDSNEDANCDIIKKMLDEWDDEDAPIAGFITMRGILPGIAVPCGKIPRDVAKEMCMCYLKLHNNG